MKLPMIPHDKANHIIYGAIIALVVMHLCIVFAGLDRWWSKGAGLLVAVIAGAVKEYIIDRAANKIEEGSATVSRGDAIATALGGALILVA